jgi:hypothetical protein
MEFIHERVHHLELALTGLMADGEIGSTIWIMVKNGRNSKKIFSFIFHFLRSRYLSLQASFLSLHAFAKTSV